MHDGGDGETGAWATLTRRALHRSLPFDTGTAILFVRARESEHGSRDSPAENPSVINAPASESVLSGEEAKSFYEDVISMPREAGAACVDPGERRKRKRRRRREEEEGGVKQQKTDEEATQVSLTGLFRFAQEGDLASLTFALSKGEYDINAKDQFDWTLLMSAAHAGQRDVVQYLLDEGARWRDCVDRKGRSASDLARLGGHAHIADAIESHRGESYSGMEEATCNCNHKRVNRQEGHERVNHQKGHQTEKETYCDVCKVRVREAQERGHRTSTVHQFSCQHKPSVTKYGIPLSNRGFQMMLRRGWDPDGGLGSQKQGQKFPVKTVLKRNRLGLGIEGSSKLRVTHFTANDDSAVRREGEAVRASADVEKVGKGKRRRERERKVARERRKEVNLRRYMNSDF